MRSPPRVSRRLTANIPAPLAIVSRPRRRLSLRDRFGRTVPVPSAPLKNVVARPDAHIDRRNVRPLTEEPPAGRGFRERPRTALVVVFDKEESRPVPLRQLAQ